MNQPCHYHPSSLPHLLSAIFQLLVVLPASAHDPYEITCTASLFSNRTELQLVMEFKTGLLLAGQNTAVSNDDPSLVFPSLLPTLKSSASQFFQVTAGSNELQATDATVTLGVENHIQFNLLFPPRMERPIQFVARGLQGLSDQGPYGATLTVLDMVNKKVIGQSVLFAANPTAAISGNPTESSEPAPQPVEISRTQLLPESANIGAPISHPAPRRAILSFAIIFPAAIACFFAFGLLWTWYRFR